MARFAPYIIKHIRLDDSPESLIQPSKEQRYYIVLWWKDIPLGQLFVEAGEDWNDHVTREKILKTISPTIDYYKKQQRLPTEDSTFFLQNKTIDTGFLEKTFSSYINNMPQIVDLSVIICTRNRSVFLERCMQSLINQISKPAEIIVVDNAPSDDSTQLVVSKFPGIIYFREPRPGLNIARNSGVQKAKYSIVAFMDDDVIPHPHWTYQVCQAFEEPGISAMTGLVIAAELQTEAQVIFEKNWSFNRGFVSKIYDSEFFDKTLAIGPPVWNIGAGANMAFRKSVFQETGYFDERLDVGAAGCNGDSEMWYRILAKGFRLAYNPRAVVHHFHRRELTALKRLLFYYMRGFTTAALIQQQLNKKAGYKRHLFWVLPKYYFHLFRYGFPRFRLRYSTIGNEIRGVLSGLWFYWANKNKPSYQAANNI